MFYLDIQEAFQRLNLRHRSPHKLRHTFLTWFYERIDQNAFLAEKVAGHRDPRDIERYNHIRQLIGREREKEKQRGSRFQLRGSHLNLAAKDPSPALV